MAAEKLLTYALGRGVDNQGHATVVRSIAHDAGAHGNRFSALVLNVVKQARLQDEHEDLQDAAATIGGNLAMFSDKTRSFVHMFLFAAWA